jgi:photosystem II stability/assembly factor-like uncharacterized protein
MAPQGNAGGVLVSTDDGVRWTVRNRGLHALPVSDVAADAEGALLAGTEGQGLFRRVNPRVPPIWSRTRVGAPFTSGAVTIGEIVNAGPGIFFATVIPDPPTTNPLWRTTDGGRTWSHVTGFEDPVTVAADPQVAGTAYALTDQGFFRTVDAGESWTPLTRPPLLAFRGLAVAPSSPPGARVLYAAGAGNSALPGARVFRSSDGGASWLDVSAGFPATTLAAIAATLAVDPLDADVVYVSLGMFSHLGQLGIWKSVDGGATWAPTEVPHESLTFPRINDLVATSVPGRLYASFANPWPLFRSDDGGATWQRDSPGTVLDIAIDPVDPNRVYAATNRGVWVREAED